MQSPAAETAAPGDSVSTPEASQADTAAVAGSGSDSKQGADAPWPREGGYDMSKRCDSLTCTSLACVIPKSLLHPKLHM